MMMMMMMKRIGFLGFVMSLMLVLNKNAYWAEAAFNCTSTGPSCDALIDYVAPNTTTFSSIKTLFGIKKLQSLLGANNFPLSTSPNQTFPANATIKIPFQCLCANGTGASNRRPIYTVLPDDNLDHIAREVFSGLVTFQQIQEANNIPDPNLITAGQRLWIPLPCSCDPVGGQRVVHYGHVVRPGSSVEGIAQQFNTSAQTLLTLNGLPTPNDLLAGAVLDVPLPACTSMVGNTSLDYPLLVANDTYVFTATNCVMCQCNAANNWTLQCEPSNGNSSAWPSCPSMQCQGAESLLLGNTTSNGCDRTTCAYAGYTNQTILTTLAMDSTCPTGTTPSSSSPRFNPQSWRWNIILIVIHLIVISLYLSY